MDVRNMHLILLITISILIRRAMECSNVVMMFEMLFMFRRLKWKKAQRQTRYTRVLVISSS